MFSSPPTACVGAVFQFVCVYACSRHVRLLSFGFHEAVEGRTAPGFWAWKHGIGWNWPLLGFGSNFPSQTFVWTQSATVKLNVNRTIHKFGTWTNRTERTFMQNTRQTHPLKLKFNLCFSLVPSGIRFYSRLPSVFFLWLPVHIQSLKFKMINL